MDEWEKKNKGNERRKNKGDVGARLEAGPALGWNRIERPSKDW